MGSGPAHPRCPGPNGAPGPAGPEEWPLEPPPPESEEAFTGVAVPPPEEVADDEVDVPLCWGWASPAEDGPASAEPEPAPLARVREGERWTFGRGCALERARCGRRAPAVLACSARSGEVGPMTAGLSPTASRAACGVRTLLGQTEPRVAATARQALAATPAMTRGRGSLSLGSRGRSNRGLRRRRCGRPGASGSAGSAAAAGAATGLGGFGACIASWIDADASLQKSSGRTGGAACISSRSLASAAGPNGTSSSRGPNQSRGKWTTFAVGSASSSGRLSCPSLSTVCRCFCGSP